MERLYKFLKPYFDSGFPSGELLESVEFYLRPEVDFKENPVCNGKFDVSLGKDFKLNDVHWADYDVNSKDWYNFGYRIMCLLTYKECFNICKEFVIGREWRYINECISLKVFRDGRVEMKEVI